MFITDDMGFLQLEWVSIPDSFHLTSQANPGRRKKANIYV